MESKLNDPDLEKGQPPDIPREQSTGGQKSSSDSLHLKDRVEGETRSNEPEDRPLEADPGAPYANHCKFDAKSWGNYLKETETEDKELTEEWRDGLDSLLVFAGLFAGILTAFLMVSSTDLSPDPQQQLLQQILNTLNNKADTALQPFEPDPSAVQINALWFTSLILTLISALASVLAKGWLIKYDPPAQREQAIDACERHLRAVRAVEWKFQPFLMIIPLLIQVSLFLFFAGLIIQVQQNGKQIWLPVVILVGLTAFLYIFGTCLPLFSPSCPFQTPFSPLLTAFPARSLYKGIANAFKMRPGGFTSLVNKSVSSTQALAEFLKRLHQKPEQAVLQSQILSWIINNATKQESVYEAIRAIAGSKPTKELQQEVTRSRAGESLFRQLENCVKMKPGLSKSVENDSPVEYVLYALLRIEQPAVASEEPTSKPISTEVLEEGHCLHRWDDFEPYLQRLAFSLRVHMLVNRGCDDHDEDWEQTRESLVQMAEMGSSRYMQKVALLATVRGILSNKLVLRRTCTIVFSRIIQSPWIREELYKLNGLMKEEKILEDDSKTSDRHNDTLQAVLKSVAELCHDSDSESIQAAVKVLTKLTEHRNFRNAIRNIIPVVTVFKDADETNSVWGELAGTLYVNLAEHVELRSAVRDAIPQLVELLKYITSGIRAGAASALGKLAEHAELRSAVRDTIPQLIELLKNGDYSARAGAASALRELFEHDEFRHVVGDAIPQFVERINDNDSDVQATAASALVNLAEDDDLRSVVAEYIPQLIELLKDHNSNIRATAASVIGKLSKHRELQSAIGDHIPQLIDHLRDGNSDIRAGAAFALGKLDEQAELQGAVGNGILQLIELLKDDDYYVRAGAASTLGELAEHDGLRGAVSGCIPQLLELLKDGQWQAQLDAASALGKMAEYAELRSAICNSIPQLIELLKETWYGVGARAVVALGKLAEHDDCCSAFGDGIPQLIELLRYEQWQTRLDAASVLGKLAENVELQSAIRDAVPRLMKLLKDSEVRGAAAFALGKLAEHVQLQDEFVVVIPSLLQSLGNSTPSTFKDLIFSLSLHPKVHNAIQLAILPSTIHSPPISTRLMGLAQSTLTEYQSDPILLQPPAYFSTPSNLTSENYGLRQLWDLLNAGDDKAVQDGIASLSIQARSFKEFIQPSAITISRMAKGARGELSWLYKLMEDAKLRPAITISILDIIKLLKDGGGITRLGTASLLEKLAEHAELRIAVRDAIPQLIGLLKDDYSNVRAGAISALGELAKHAELRNAVGDGIPQVIDLLKDGSYGGHEVRAAATSGLGELAEHAELRGMVGDAIPQLVELLKDIFPEVRAGAVSALGKMAEHAELRKVIHDAIPQLIKLIKHSSSYVRTSAASALGKLAEHAELRSEVRDVIPQFIELLNDESSDYRSGATFALERLAEQDELQSAVGDAIPRLIELLKDPYNDVQSPAAFALAELAEHTELRSAIYPAIPQLLELLKSIFSNVQATAAFALGKLAAHAELRAAVGNVIPQLIELLKDYDPDVRARAVSTFEEMAKHAELRSAVRDATPQLIKLLKDDNSDHRSGAAAALGKLAVHTELRSVTRDAIPPLIELLKDSRFGVRTGAASTLGKLVEPVHPFSSIPPVIASLLNLFDIEDFRVSTNANHLIRATTVYYGSLKPPVLNAQHPVEVPQFSAHGGPLVEIMLPLLKDNSLRIRVAAAEVIETLIRNPATASAMVQRQPQTIWFDYLRDTEPIILKPVTEIFCLLVDQDYIRKNILSVILDALKAVDDPDKDVQYRGITILSVMASYPQLRRSLAEVMSIHASAKHFLDLSSQDACTLVQKMEYFGLLTEL